MILGLVLCLAVGGAGFYYFSREKAKNIQVVTTLAVAEPPLNLTHEVNKASRFEREWLPTTPLAQEMDAWITKSGMIGTALVIQEDKIILQKGYGYADVETGRKNSWDTLFQLVSVQKGYTSVLIMQLVEQGKLQMDETIEKFYPNVPYASNVTIRELLTMKSGLFRTIAPDRVMTDEEYIDFAAKNITAAPTEKWKYSAINFTLLTGILEKVTKKSYEELFREQFIEKNHLTSLTFFDDFVKSPLQAKDYAKKDGVDYAEVLPLNPVEYKAELGTGNIATNVGDLYRFYQQLIAGKMISKDMLKVLWTKPENSSYSGGAYQRSKYIYAHGNLGGFELTVFVSKDGKQAVILGINQRPNDKSSIELGKTLFSALGFNAQA
jgi:CubicO group peptidase (beta-lactamase class C family)